MIAAATELFSLGLLDRADQHRAGLGYGWKLSSEASQLLEASGLSRTLPKMSLSVMHNIDQADAEGPTYVPSED